MAPNVSMATRGKHVPKKFDVNRIPGQPKKRRKITLVFDEEKRRDFLGGFHKRKLQRRKKAQEELQQQLKEERKKIKLDAREKYKKMVVSRRDIPELEELLAKEEYETEGHTVSVLELNAADLVEKSNWIGENRVSYVPDETTNENETTDCGSETEEVPGMELTKKKQTKEVKSVKASEKKVETVEEPKTKKELKRAVRLGALKRVQKSKPFQIKQKLERQKNKKKSLQKKKMLEKVAKGAKGAKRPEGKVKRKHR